jgi:osmotically-inducible protein OsmY
MTRYLLAPTDNDLLNDFLRQLESDPQISCRDIAIAAKGGVVTLSGFVCSYEEGPLSVRHCLTQKA